MNWWRRRSLRIRLVVGFSLITSAFVGAVSVVVYQSMARQLVAIIDDSLDERMSDLAATIRTRGFDVSTPDDFTQLLDTNAAVRASSPRLGDSAPLVDVDQIQTLERNQVIRWTSFVDNVGQQVRFRLERLERRSGPIFVVVGRSVEVVEQNRRDLLNVFLLSTPLLIVTISALGWFLARAVLRPVQRMADQARRLKPESHRDLDVGMSAGDDEFSALAASFNQLLERIETARQHERRFIADVSHELRTPLALVRGEIELAAALIQDPLVATSLRTATEEVSRMTRLVTRLLQIARVEAGQITLHCIPTDIDQLLDEIMASLPNPSSPEPIRLRHMKSGAGLVLLDPDVVTEIMINVLNNAVRHASSVVTVQTSIGAGNLILTVTDDGSGFHQLSATRRLHRFNTGATPAIKAEPRIGLGLSIVQALLQVHGGRIVLSNVHKGGARVTIHVVPGVVA